MAKTIYFIRHAMTEANKSGSMVKNYEETDILPFDVLDWQQSYKNIITNVDAIFTSNTKRTKQTAEALFPFFRHTVMHGLNEFDCSGLGNKKFWEISEEEFNNHVDLTTYDMKVQTEQLLRRLVDGTNYQNIVCISHGMLIRYICDSCLGYVCTPYTEINSKYTKFGNLDVAKLEFSNIVDGNYRFDNLTIYPYSAIINHKENTNAR